MPSISGAVPNLIGGVSQQPPSIRLDNTAEELRNATLSVVTGKRKRGPMKLQAITNIPNSAGNTPAYFLWDRGGDRSRHVVVAGGQVRVYRMDGTQEPVTMASGTAAYLPTAAQMRDAIGFCPVGDGLFLFNRLRNVGTLGGTKPVTSTALGQYHTFVVERVAAMTEYQIEVNGSVVRTVTRENDPSDPRRIAAMLSTANNGDPTNRTPYDNVISVPRFGSDFFGGPSPLIRNYVDEVHQFSFLPPVERPNRRVKVLAEPDASDSGYYVRYNAETRMWDETYGPGSGVQVRLDPATMPHILKDNGDGTWSFEREVWDERVVGDEQSNPLPSFVGWPIQALFVIRDRLSILADENIVMSQVGVYTNFFRTTVTTLRDDDRIDASVSAPGRPAVTLRHAVTFNEALLLFSDKGQYRVEINDLSPGQFRILPSTNFSAESKAQPAYLDRNVVFVDDPEEGGSWASLRELMIDEVVGVQSSDPLTKQVPEYIPRGVFKIASTDSVGVAAVFTEGDPEKLFIYSYYWGPEGRIQSAWNHWESPGTLFLNGGFIGKRLHLLVRMPWAASGSQYAFVTVDLEESFEGDLEGLEVLLDYRVDEAGVTSVTQVADDTVVQLPYRLPPNAPVYLVIREDTIQTLPDGDTVPSPRPGAVFQGTVDPTDLRKARFPGVYLVGTKFWVGSAYEFSWKLSTLFVRDPQKVVIQDGRLQIRKLSFLFHQTSLFDVVVRAPFRAPRRYRFTGRFMGSDRNRFGQVAVEDGQFRVPVSQLNWDMDVTVVNDGPFQSRFSSIEWEGAWRPRTARINR